MTRESSKTLERLLSEPVMEGLLRPYTEGVKGGGAESLNVVKFGDMIDTQLLLGLHKARLRSRISARRGPARNFISLTYYEPFQALVSQTLGQRVRYFAGILSRLLFNVKTDFVTYLTAEFMGSAGRCKKVLGELVRAMISLKDLDELLAMPDKTEQAISLFCEGVSNIHGYFNALRCLEFALTGQVSEESLAIILRQEELNAREVELLLKNDLPRMAKRSDVNAATAGAVRSVLTSQIGG